MSAARKEGNSAAAEPWSAAEFRRAVKRGLSGCYLFCGEEAFMARHCLAEARAAVNADPAMAAFSLLRLSGSAEDLTMDAIAAAASVPPMFCERKLVEVHELDYASLSSSALEELCDALDRSSGLTDTAVILYATPAELDPGSRKKPSALLRTLAAHLCVVRFDSQTPAQLASWLIRHFAAEGITAESAQCYELMKQCGHSMDVLSGETEKLCAILHARGENRLTEQLIAQAASHNLEADTLISRMRFFGERLCEPMKFLRTAEDGKNGRNFCLLRCQAFAAICIRCACCWMPE